MLLFLKVEEIGRRFLKLVNDAHEKQVGVIFSLYCAFTAAYVNNAV